MTSSHDAYAHIQGAVEDLAADPRVPEPVRMQLSGLFDEMDSNSVTLGQADMNAIIVALASLADNQAPKH
ncbi:MAG: hypothetical protein ACOCYG_09300 [Spirochaetota bacterium]